MRPRRAHMCEAFKSRIVLIFGSISDGTAAEAARRLIALDADSDDPIDMIVSSPGGHLESGDTIHDLIRFIRAPVRMIGSGWGGGAATNGYLASRRVTDHPQHRQTTRIGAGAH